MTNHQIITLLFLQLTIILIITKLIGAIIARFGQPQVVGEMVAGVLMGPSVFGLFFPESYQALFPSQLKPILYSLAQIGVALYMFTVGCEFNLKSLNEKIKAGLNVAIAGVLLPFLTGILLAFLLNNNPQYFNPNANFKEISLFLGAAISITAFPMLARIIYERKLTGSYIGTLSLIAGAFNDVIAWILLALVLASFSGKTEDAYIAVIGGLLTVAIIFCLIKPILEKLYFRLQSNETLWNSIIFMFFVGICFFTSYVHLHPVFGAFLLGIAIPKGMPSNKLQEQLAPLTSNFLLPIFFVYTGLSTSLSLLINMEVFPILFIIIVASCLAKGGGCYLAARFSGLTNKESFAIGSLMNARGLMELILITIGLEHGIITVTMYSILVVMAIVTTFLATPLFSLSLKENR